MSPLDFIELMQQRLDAKRIRFALTSGQACVYYGIQQTTKDSDWIVEPEDLELLVGLLNSASEDEGWRVSYHSICGAPLVSNYLAHGWTSHLTIHDGYAEQRLDFFGKAPRVYCVETNPDLPGIASRHTVALMKKTDRDKDWPMVYVCGMQMLDRGDYRGLLHVQDAEILIAAWPSIPRPVQVELARTRPLLNLIDTDRAKLRRAIALERLAWSTVNRVRYTKFQHEWKEFFRRWRREPGMHWPIVAPFADQHAKLVAACQHYQLPQIILNESLRSKAWEQARKDSAEIMAATDAEFESFVPSIEVMLP